MSGRISYYGNIVKDGLVLCLDAAKKDSYPRSGTLWNDISGGQRNGTLINGPTFNPNNDKIWLYVKNRNMADLLRTLAHELVHRKQDEDGRINNNSGETGSEIENEANAMAGILLRDFGKIDKEIYQ